MSSDDGGEYALRKPLIDASPFAFSVTMFFPVLFISIACTRLSSADECIRKCREEFPIEANISLPDDYIRTLTGSSLGKTSFAQSEVESRASELCIRLDQLDLCLWKCGSMEAEVHRTANSNWKYVCGDLMSMYWPEHQCMFDVHEHDSKFVCVEQTSVMFDIPREFLDGVPPRHLIWQLNQLSECISSAYAKHCGSSAGIVGKWLLYKKESVCRMLEIKYDSLPIECSELVHTTTIPNAAKSGTSLVGLFFACLILQLSKH